MKPRKLGRGLDVLLEKARNVKGAPEKGEAEATAEPDPDAGTDNGEAPSPATPGEPTAGESLELPVVAIDPNPEQPRKSFDRKELESLMASISREGVLQPVLVRRRGDGYQLVAGERRHRAAQELGLETIPAVLIDVEDERMLELALIENIQREDLNPIETARAFEALLSLKGWTQEELARNLGVSRPLVSNTLRLLELPENMRRALARGQIQMGHAKVLLSVSSAKERQQLFEKIAEDRLSVRDLEIAREAVESPPGRGSGKGGTRRRRRASKSSKSPEVVRLEEELTQVLGTKVTIQEKKGRGEIRLEFYSPDDFEHLRKILLAGGH